MRRRRLHQVLILLFGYFIQISVAGPDNLVSLNGDSQNSRFVEIRRAPPRRAAVDDAPSYSGLPKAHGLFAGPRSHPSEVRRAPQGPGAPQSQAGAGLPPPFAPLMPNLLAPFALPGFPLMSSLSNAHPHSPLQPLPGAATAPPAGRAPHEIQTLSATMAPSFTFPTLPTLFPMPTFPPFTMPPSFDRMAAGYTKKKKKRRRHGRRKQARKTSASEALDKIGVREPSQSSFEKAINSLPQAEFEVPVKKHKPVAVSDKEWMVPYYSDKAVKNKQ